MLLNTDYIEPAELTGYMREGLANQPINQFALAQWLPNRDIDDLTYRFERGAGGLLEAAEYRSYDTGSPIGAREGITRVSGELPPISRKIRLGEYDRLRQRQDPQAGIRNGLLADGEKMAREVAARIELARGDALVNGSVTISENGVVASVSFGRAGAMAVSAATAWSDLANATPLTNMITWRDAYSDQNGASPEATLTSRKVLGYLQRSAEIRGQFSTLAGTPSIVSVAAVNEVLQAHDLPPIMLYDAKVKVGGVATRIVAENRLLFLPAPVAPSDWQGTQLGATFWGTTAESLEPDYGLAGTEDAPGIVGGVYSTKDPVALWTKAAAIALPVMANPDLAMVAATY